jgi:hypothetical protein
MGGERINSAVSKYWHTKAIGKLYGMPRSVGKPQHCLWPKIRMPKWESQGKRERWTAFTTNQE